jgi:hypothetical protein
MNSYKQIYSELKKLSRKIPACSFIPEEDRKEIVSASMEQIYKLYVEGKLKDDFNEIKGYNFIIIRNMCFSYKKKNAKIEFVGIIDDTLNDVIEDIVEQEKDYEKKKKIILEHSRYYKFTPEQRKYIELSLIYNLRIDAIKRILNVEKKDIQKVSTGAYHRLRGRKNKTYKYKVYDVENPNEYFLYDTTQSVMKYLQIENLKKLKQIIKEGIIYKNKRIQEYEN